jgi:hypothetical protein
MAHSEVAVNAPALPSPRIRPAVDNAPNYPTQCEEKERRKKHYIVSLSFLKTLLITPQYLLITPQYLRITPALRYKPHKASLCTRILILRLSTAS